MIVCNVKCSMCNMHPCCYTGMSRARHGMSRSRSWHVQIQVPACSDPGMAFPCRGHGMSRSRSWHVQIQVLACPFPDPGMSRLSWLLLACPGLVPGMSRLSWLILACPSLGPGMYRSRHAYPGPGHGMSSFRSWHVHAQILVCPDCPG